MSYLKNSKRETGAAMLEFAISAPFLLLMICGLGHIGRLYSQLSWVSNVNYFATLNGTRARSEMVSDSSLAAFNRLYNDHAYNKNARVENAVAKSGYPELNSADKTIHFVSQANTALLPLAFITYNKTVKHDLVGPLLVVNPDASSGDLSTFANEDSSNATWYNCLGQQVSSSSDPYCDFY